jgi:hypothetical protein
LDCWGRFLNSKMSRAPSFSQRTQPAPVVRQHPKEPVRQISLMQWGLIPNWAEDASIASSTINAKSEAAATKPAFRDPLRFRGCLIPADAFYELKRQPFCFEVNEGELFAFAGLWDGCKDSTRTWIKTFELQIPDGIWALALRLIGCKMSAGYRVYLPPLRSPTDARETSCLISLCGY